MKTQTHTPEQLDSLRKQGHTFKAIAELTGLTENTVKTRIYKKARAYVTTIKSRPANLTQEQRHRAANLHYFGYPPCEIAADIEASAEDVRIYVSELPRHPEFEKKSA